MTSSIAPLSSPKNEASKSFDKHNLHINNIQAQILNADCKEMYCAMARGAGKTHVLSIYESRNMHTMPGCTRLLLGPSYRKLLGDLLANLVVGWAKLGYKKNEHYVIGNSSIPKKLGWDDPIYVPEPQYRQFTIHWYTGASIRLGSADRKVTLNGLNLDGISADEVKLIDEDIFREVIKVNRANTDRKWSNLPEHNSIICFTDKYWTKAGGDWIMKKKSIAQPERVKNILKVQARLNQITEVDERGNIFFTNMQEAELAIEKLQEWRNETVAFFEAPVYVNIPLVKPDYILQMKRNMGEMEFRASMLNHDMVRNDQKEYFYPTLSEAAHGYVADDFEKIDGLEFDFERLSQTDCTFDTDLDKTKPIEISCDWGGNINCLMVFQEKFRSLNAINSFFVKHPQHIEHLAKDFCNYYRPHKPRDLKFYYDPSGNNKQANSSETIAQEFARYLRADGWNVQMMHLGAHNNPLYELRYDLWQMILAPSKDHDPKYPFFFMNKNNCKEPFVSMLDAGLIKYGKKLKKDKSSEKPGSGVPPELATNFSDCADYIVMHKYGKLLKKSLILPDTMGDAM